MAAIDDPSTDQRSLEMRRRFAAPRDAVFRAWTEPAAMSQWWGPAGSTTPLCELDLRPGGAWRTCIRTAEGNEIVLGGVYREIAPPARLVFTWAREIDGVAGHETLVTLEFHDLGRATELVLTQAEFETAEIRGQHDRGWANFLDSLDQYLSGMEN